MDLVVLRGARNSTGFGYVVVGWLRGRNVDLSAPLETWAAVSDFLAIVREHTDHVAWIARAEDQERRQLIEGETVADKRIYAVKVNQKDGDAGRGVPDSIKTHLVRAGNPAQAIRHVAKGMISAEVPSQDELVVLSKEAEVEDAGESA